MIPITPILSRMFRLIVLFAVLLAGCDRDGSNGDSRGPDPAEPQFNLTGYWSPTEPIDCEISNLEGLLEALLVAVLDSPEFHTDQMGNDLEADELESDLSAVMNSEFHIDQMGNDLEITLESTDGSEVQLHGTIIGDQVRFSQSEERRLQALEVDIHTEVRGTVFDEDRMVLTQESDWTVQIQDGEPVTGEIICTFHAARKAT